MNVFSRTNFAVVFFLGLFLALVLYKPSPPRSGKITVQYWEKWNGIEADAMRAVVDDFNSSQNRIFVQYTSVSNLDRKIMLATAGGDPPDVAGIYSNTLPVYADNNALIPLDALARKYQIKREDYTDVFWRMCLYRDHLWALPTTPGSLGLVWNKKLFRGAGLDPNQPPRSNFLTKGSPAEHPTIA
jgi:multiple sugar transport system substrate-binding protein